jgi:L-ascorbate metabolism protein UlaG (beta-lactamase superfamily)
MLDTKGNKISYFGHSAFGLTTAAGAVALIDPWLTNPLCPKELQEPKRVDAIFLSHAHGDHMGNTVALAKKHKCTVVCMVETAAWLTSKGIGEQVKEMNKGGSFTAGEFGVTLTHAFHSNSIEDGDKVIYAGEPAGLIVRMPGGFTIYHAGDTAVFGDMQLIAEIYRPDLAILPIGDNYTMGPREAAYAVKLLGVGHVVPMHYATFPVLTGTVEAFRKQCSEIAGPVTVHGLRPGESLGGEHSAGARGD